MTIKHPWLNQVISELRELSADLLDAGLASSSFGVKSSLLGSSLQITLSQVNTIYCQVPNLIEELGTEDSYQLSELIPTAVPRYSVVSNRPCDYAVKDGQPILHRWLRQQPEQALPVAPLRYLRFVINQIAEELAIHRSRYEKYVNVARIARDGDSSYAVMDRELLERLISEIRHAEFKLRFSDQFVTRRAGENLSPCKKRPDPFPRSKYWQSFRRFAESILNQINGLLPRIDELLRNPISGADAPFLYQRWCGLQIVRSAERLGWNAVGDLVGPLFLGGPIRLLGGGEVTLWVEPRISKRTAAQTGWICVKQHEELTPDFLLVCGPLGRRDGFVLDATLCTSEEALEGKGRYRERLKGCDGAIVAGIPVVRQPLRSWAVAPLRSRYCRLDDPLGWTGTIPLRPEDQDRSALDAWLRDVLSQAERA